MSVVLTEEYNVKDNSEEFIGTTEYLMILTGYRINPYRYYRVRMYFTKIHTSSAVVS